MIGEKKDKKKRNRRNRKIREYQKVLGLGTHWLWLEKYTEEEKDSMHSKIKSLQLAAFVCKPQIPSYLSTYIIDDVIPNQENTMNTTVNNIVEERRVLINSVDSARRDHREKIDEHFAINPYSPKTATEYVNLLKEGKYDFGEYKEEADDPMYFKTNWVSPASIIRFLPKEVDKLGHSKAIAAMTEAAEELFLEIKVLEPEKTLPKVKEFKKKSFH